MRNRNPTLLLLVSLASIACAALLYSSATSQSRNKNQNQNSKDPGASEDVLRIDTDLVKIDALVMQKSTARIVGGLKKEDFLLYEDGTKQEITHFSKDSLPLSVMLLIDRGGCLDPYPVEVHRAAREAIDRLKLVDEIAIMTYHMSTDLVQPFTTNRMILEQALGEITPQDVVAPHCLNKVFADAAKYMMRASNPSGRRVIILITGITRAWDCADGISARSAAHEVYESGSVVCGIIPKITGQALENGLNIMATRISKVGGVDYMDVETLANETGGEVLSDKPEKLDTTFQTLIEHLRSRYNLAFVSSNKKRDGTTRKLKLDLTSPIQNSNGKLVIKARRSYIAPRD
jgi:VWFA-related protein